MRKINTHKIAECSIPEPAQLNDLIQVEATDDPGSGNAHHAYQFSLYRDKEWQKQGRVDFQKGPLHEPGAGVNGISNEALLAVVIDRLRCFQAGPMNYWENFHALAKLEEAMHWLHHRTRDRLNRGVEGTENK